MPQQFMIFLLDVDLCTLHVLVENMFGTIHLSVYNQQMCLHSIYLCQCVKCFMSTYCYRYILKIKFYPKTVKSLQRRVTIK